MSHGAAPSASAPSFLPTITVPQTSNRCASRHTKMGHGSTATSTPRITHKTAAGSRLARNFLCQAMAIRQLQDTGLVCSEDVAGLTLSYPEPQLLARQFGSVTIGSNRVEALPATTLGTLEAIGWQIIGSDTKRPPVTDLDAWNIAVDTTKMATGSSTCTPTTSTSLPILRQPCLHWQPWQSASVTPNAPWSLIAIGYFALSAACSTHFAGSRRFIATR